MSRKMNAMLAACLGYLVVASTLAECSQPTLEDWENYKLEFGKVYPTYKEDAFRRSVFMVRKQAIDQFNELSTGYKVGLNPMTDWSDEERLARNGFSDRIYSMDNSDEARNFVKSIIHSKGPVPKSINWCELGRCSPVQDQGKCGSDWAFATAGLLEGQHRLKNEATGKTVRLSVQQLLECPDPSRTRLDGCSKGDMFNALQYIASRRGIASASSYPYLGAPEECRFLKIEAALQVKGGAVVEEDEETLKKIVGLFGPVATGVDGRTFGFQEYKSGIFDAPCDHLNNNADHAVLIVGYGTDNDDGKEYWIIKNSWGPHWGENGFMRIARNKKTCRIGATAVIPLLHDE